MYRILDCERSTRPRDQTGAWSGLISVAVFPSSIYQDGLLPAEHEVTCRRPQGHRQAQPDVVGHEDQHEAVGENYLQPGLRERSEDRDQYLDKLEDSLQQMTSGQDLGLNDLHLDTLTV